MRILPPYGSKHPDYLFMEHAPGAESVRNGTLFNDQGGRLLFDYMETAQVPTEDCYFTAFHKRAFPQGDIPSVEEIAMSLQYVEQELLATQPKVIFTVGAQTFFALTGKKYTQTHKKGYTHTITQEGIELKLWIMPLISPWAVLKGGRKFEPEIIKTLVNTRSMLHPDELIPTDYRYLDTVEKVKEYLDSVLKMWKDEVLDEYICIDLETNKLEAFWDNSKCIMAVITHKAHQSCAIPFEHPESPFSPGFGLEEVKELFRAFVDSGIPIVNQNFKFDYQWFRKYFGCAGANHVGDTMLASYTIKNKTSRHSLDELIPTVLGKASHKNKIGAYLDKLPKEQWSYYNVPMSLLLEYAYEDSDLTWQIQKKLDKKMHELNLYDFYVTVMLEGSYFFAEMEFNGAWVQRKMIPEVRDFYVDYVDESAYTVFDNEWAQTACAIHKGAKKLTSWQFLEVLLYHQDAFGLPMYKKVKKKGRIHRDEEDEEDGRGGTGKLMLNLFDEDINEALNREGVHPYLKNMSGDPVYFEREKLETVLSAIKALVIWKKNSKLFSSYVKSLPEIIQDDECVHPSFRLASVATGRTSCSNPPMQTFPYHSKAKDPFQSRFEGGFIAGIDYSQQELRVAAMFSGDKAMRQAFIEKKDIHRMITSDIMKIPFHEVPDELRRHFKTIVFGILYGRGAKAIAAALGIPVDEAQHYINLFYEMRVELKEWIDMMQATAKSGENYVTTPFGRRIMIYEPGDYEEHNVNRYVINYPIQGTASDFTLVAGARIQRDMTRLNLQSRTFNFVHDSVMFDVHPTEVEVIWRLAQYYMVQYPAENFDFMNGVPLNADAEIGIQWGHAVEYMFNDTGLVLTGNAANLGSVVPTMEKAGFKLLNVENLGLNEGDYQLKYLMERPESAVLAPDYA